MRFLTYILVGAGALLAVVALAVFLLNSGEPDAVAPQGDGDQVTSAPSDGETSVLQDAQPAGAGVSGAASAPEGGGLASTTTRESTLKIDLAQVKPDGNAVFAGTALPNAKITIFEGKKGN